LALIECNVLPLQLPHFLNFIEVHHEALLVRVFNLNALSAEDGAVIRAVEMHYPLVVRHAELALHSLGAFVVEVNQAQERVSLNDLVQDVDVQGEALRRLEVLYELPTYWTAHAEVFEQAISKALSAKCMPAMYKDARDACTHVVLLSTEMTVV